MMRKDWQQARAEADAALGHHQATPRQSRSWHFARPDKEGRPISTYSYSVTWAPGTIILAGDLGELTVTHYNATSTLHEAARWMQASNFRYIMEKSDADQELCTDRTAAFIVEMANGEALGSLRHVHDERRRWRRDVAQATEDWRDWLAIATAADPPMPAPDLADYLPDPCGYDTAHPALCAAGHGAHTAPDGWELWTRIAHVLDRAPGSITTAAGRRELKRAMAGYVSPMEAHNAASFCRTLGLDDYYGSYDYSPHRMGQFVALQRWAAHVITTEPAPPLRQEVEAAHG